MDSEKLFEKLVNNEISREEFEALLEHIEDDQLRAKYDEYLYSLFMEEVNARTNKQRDLPQKPDKAKKTRKTNHRKYYSIAATLLIISSIGLIVWTQIPEFEGKDLQESDFSIDQKLEIKNTPTKRMFRTRLADGSFVHLNAVSSLSYPRQFSEDRREVEITGEAYFDVNHDESRPFIINVKSFRIEVLGTSFNIRAYDDDDNFSVVVESGSVKVKLTQGSEPIILTKNQKLSYALSNGQLALTRVNAEEELSWRKGILRFDSTPMKEVEKILERWYGVDVFIQDSSIYNKSLTGIHQNENIRSVLESITYATDTRYEIRNNQIIIKK